MTDAQTDHPAVRAVREALRAAGAGGEIRLLPDAVHTASAAAAALGVRIGQIANSLVFAAYFTDEPAPLLVLTSGAHRVDTDRVAALLGAASIRRASPEFVRAHTGSPIGGVAPVGHPAPIRTLVDTALGDHDEVWAAGGVPRAVFPSTFTELVRVTGGTPVDVA